MFFLAFHTKAVSKASPNDTSLSKVFITILTQLTPHVLTSLKVRFVGK